MPIDLPPPVPGIEVVLATHGMTKGIGQTTGPQLLAKASVAFGDVKFGAQWKNVDSSNASGETWLTASGSHSLGTVRLTGGVTYKIQTGVRGDGRSTSLEFSAGAIRKFGPVKLRLNAIYSPDDLGPARRSLFVEGGPAVQFAKGWTASASVGPREREGGVDYFAFNAGVAKAVGPLQFDLRYFDTDRSGVGDPYQARIVASAKLAF